jgi:hypothetical protein
MKEKTLIPFLFLFSLTFSFFHCATETKEKELFRVSTARSTYVQFNVAENENKLGYLFVQIILCQFLSSGSHISITNDLGEEIFGTDIISSRNFFLDLEEQFNNSLIINATSSDMYIQYQYVNESKGVILASGNIREYEFGNNYITFNVSPVVNNTETSYDLYYLGKINIYNDICQKVKFVLENEPIATVTYHGYNYFDLEFENLENKTGYYLIKGNNVNDVSYYYFYERINVVNRLGPFKTNNIEFFEVKSESDEYYSIFTTPGNPERKKYLNLQIILCQPFGDQKSHISILNENYVEIFFSDVITSRQTNIDILYSNNITIMTTSPHMYIQYQFTDIYYYPMPYGFINSYNSNPTEHYIDFNVTPIEVNSSIYYALFYAKNESLISGECKKLVYSLNNNPISTLNAFGSKYINLNFTYDLTGDGNNETGYTFIKTYNVNSTNYTFFYNTVNVTINYKKNENNDDMILLLTLLYIIIGVCVIAVFIVIYILCQQGICSKNKSDEIPNSISLINRTTE